MLCPFCSDQLWCCNTIHLVIVYISYIRAPFNVVLRFYNRNIKQLVFFVLLYDKCNFIWMCYAVCCLVRSCNRPIMCLFMNQSFKQITDIVKSHIKLRLNILNIVDETLTRFFTSGLPLDLWYESYRCGRYCGWCGVGCGEKTYR